MQRSWQWCIFLSGVRVCIASLDYDDTGSALPPVPLPTASRSEGYLGPPPLALPPAHSHSAGSGRPIERINSGRPLIRCKTDFECSLRPYAPICNEGICKTEPGYNYQLGECVCEYAPWVPGDAQCSLQDIVSMKSTANFSSCFDECTKQAGCGAVGGTWDSSNNTFNCILMAAPAGCNVLSGDCRILGNGVRSLNFCYILRLKDADCKDHPGCGSLGRCCPSSDGVMLDCCTEGENRSSLPWIYVEIVMPIVAIVVFSLSFFVCARQRSQFTIRRRRQEANDRFHRSLEDIRADVHGAGTNLNSVTFTHDGSAGGLMAGFAAQRSYDDMYEERYNYRNSCHAVPNAEILSLHDFYSSWLSTGQAPCYVLAFVNSKSGNQSSQALIREFNRAFSADDHRERSIGKVCELNVADSISLAFHDLEEVCRVNRFGRNKIRLLVCGGDGTVTWVLSEIEKCMKDHPNLIKQQPPIGIVPLGTGNDLARSLGWGKRLTDSAQVVKYIRQAIAGDSVALDQWKVTIKPKFMFPAALQPEFSLSHVGYFQNYFSVGMDAKTTQRVEVSRRDCCGRSCFRCGCGKSCYAVHAPCPCCPGRSFASDISVKYYSSKAEYDSRTSHVWDFGGRVRQFTMTNINSYGGGLCVFDDATLASVTPHDHLLEAFHASGPCHALSWLFWKGARTTKVYRAEMIFDEGQFFQMDGEAFVVDSPCEVTVEWNRRVTMLRPPSTGEAKGSWCGRQDPSFWDAAAREASSARALASPQFAKQSF